MLPVFVHPAERDKFVAVENMTIQEIKLLVDGSLQFVVDDDVREVLECLWLETTQKSRPATKTAVLNVLKMQMRMRMHSV